MKLISNTNGFLNIFKEVPDNFLRQGDIFLLNTINPPHEGIIGWLLTNADCDVVSPKKTNYYVLAAIEDLSFYIKNITANKNKLNSLISQKYAEWYFIPPESNLSLNGCVVNFGFLFSLPEILKFDPPDSDFNNQITSWEYLLQKRILSMKHEWRAEFSFRLSNYFGRMGSPDPSPEDKKLMKTWLESQITQYK